MACCQQKNYSGVEMDFRDRLLFLMSQKSKKDGKKFNASNLALATNTPNSVIAKLLSNDIEKRVLNPRIETVKKIKEYFLKEGFNVSLDYLAYGKEIDIDSSLEMNKKYIKKDLPVFTLETFLEPKPAPESFDVNKTISDPMVFKAEKKITSFFNEGTIFIVDKKRELEDGAMGVFLNEQSIPVIRVIHIEKGKVFFSDINSEKKLNDVSICNIIGIVSQIVTG